MSEDQGENMPKSIKRKKKRSFNQMAKKMARSRSYAGELESNAYQYMVRVSEMLRTEFPKMDDKLIFANNVYEETKGQEADYARNQVGSRVLEILMPFANFEAIKRMLDAFQNDLRPMCSDRFSSHVLQKLICVCVDRGNESSDKEKDANLVKVKKGEKNQYNEMALKLCKYVINNMEEFVWDTYANHVLRTVLECLGGLINKPKDRKDKSGSNLVSRRIVVQSFTDLLVDSCKRMHRWPQFQEFGKSELTSGLLQSVLHSLKDVDPELCSTIINKITNENFASEDENKLIALLESDSSARLIEVCLAVSDPKTFAQIHEKYFAKKLGQLSVMRSANFCVQRLLDNCSSRELFEEIFDEISNNFDMIFQRQFGGVLVSVANACLRLRSKQGPFINLMMKTLHCEEAKRQKEIARLLASLATYEKLEEARKEKKNLPLQVYGSVILQATLKFNKPIKIVNSLLEANTEDLIFIFGDSKGSWIVDTFMESEFVGEKSREKLARKLQGYWVQLASTTHGSRSLDKIWKKVNEKQRMVIMEELAKVGESLRSTRTGKIISANLKVPLFARSKKEWTEAQGKEGKTKALFADIIDTNLKSEDD
ncbi:nucleolar protein 9 [Belonocnema kinseyi]|uniref:nucleolar protein 9 n=1 Tax=Belonocnema kinseyi TaxID=2817044 RepID=UPI00143D39C4|nr:nucleolar protein 9 [Belonocnema kinseyi]